MQQPENKSSIGAKRAQAAAIRQAKAGQRLGARCQASWNRLLCERPIVVLVTLLLTAVAIITWHTGRQLSTQMEAQALQGAEQLANALAEFRTAYTSEVVERVRQQGITITHDYEHREGAIPLPATLSMMLGNRTGHHDSQTRTRLYSAYPFPWRRTDGGLTDDFAKDAWAFLARNPDMPFYRFEELGGVTVLRYATADLMRADCVDCHNNHLDSPKTDWRVGDVRGVLEVIAPLAIPLGGTHSGVIETAGLMILITLVALAVIGVVLRHLRQVATEAQDLARHTNEANEELEREVAERHRAEEALRELNDSLELRVAARQRELQAQNDELRRTEKLASLGTLAGGVAHDFNNLLMVIDGYCKRAIEQMTEPAVAQESLNRVINAANKGAALTRQLLTFSRRKPQELQILRVIDLIAEVKNLAEPLLGELHYLEVQTEINDATINIDPNELGQAMLNLIINGRDAMTKGGTIVLSCKEVEADAVVAAGSGIQPGRYASLSVADNGNGIDPDTLNRIFEPFFTTKATGKGTGLGLAMVYGFAQESGGYVDVKSEQGKGSCFTLYLPLVDLVPDVQTVAKLPNLISKGETVLLAEDNDDIRALLKCTLETLGYTVLVASDGFEALEVDEDHEGEIDLLLSDVVMPALDGFELGRLLKRKRQGLRVLFMSGYHDTNSEQSCPNDARLLHKPVAPVALAAAVRDELDRVP